MDYTLFQQFVASETSKEAPKMESTEQFSELVNRIAHRLFASNCALCHKCTTLYTPDHKLVLKDSHSETNVTIAEALEYLLLFDAYEDQPLHNICYDCIVEISNAFLFKNKCLKTTKAFRNLTKMVLEKVDKINSTEIDLPFSTILEFADLEPHTDDNVTSLKYKVSEGTNTKKQLFKIENVKTESEDEPLKLDVIKSEQQTVLAPVDNKETRSRCTDCMTLLGISYVDRNDSHKCTLCDVNLATHRRTVSHLLKHKHAEMSDTGIRTVGWKARVSLQAEYGRAAAILLRGRPMCCVCARDSRDVASLTPTLTRMLCAALNLQYVDRFTPVVICPPCSRNVATAYHLAPRYHATTSMLHACVTHLQLCILHGRSASDSLTLKCLTTDRKHTVKKEIHEESKSSNDQFRCDKCSKTFSSAFHLRRHRAKHGSPDTYECRQCDLELPTHDRLWNHQWTVHNIGKPSNNHIRECPKCEQFFVVYKNYSQHRKTHGEDDPYLCKLCGQTFEFHRQLKEHKQAYHKEVDRCVFCKIIVPTADLSAHVESVHLPKVFCDHCGMFFYNTRSLALHIRKKHNASAVREFEETAGENDDDAEDRTEDRSGEDNTVAYEKVREAINKRKESFECHLCGNMCVTGIDHGCPYDCIECHISPCVHYKYIESFAKIGAQKCLDCDFDHGNSLKSLLQHVEENHPIGNACEECAQVFKSRYALNDHLRDCTFAPLENEAVVSKQTVSVESVTSKPYACNVCKQNFKSLASILRHYCTWVDKCRHCLNKYKSKFEARKHERRCARIEKPLRCDVCEARFASEKMLSRHALRHGNFARSVCTVCDKVYPSKEELQAHVCFPTFEPEKRRVEEDEVQKKPKKYIMCERCGKIFAHPSDLKIHMSYHAGRATRRANTSSSIMCDTCGNMVDARHMKKHMSSHDTRAVLCDVCSKLVPQRLLDSHLRSHTGEPGKRTYKRMYSCEHCGFANPFRARLEYHINRVHMQQKPFACRKCDKAFYSHKNLVSHQKCHSDWRGDCEICKQTFTTPIGLTLHMRRHTGERPYKCSACDEKFVSSSVRLTHFRKAHGRPECVCNVCGKGFYYDRALRMHLKRHYRDYGPKSANRVVTGQRLCRS